MRSNENAKNKEPVIEISSEETTETVIAPESAESISPKQALVYCGPSLPKGILTQFITYLGGYPKHLELHISKCPAIGRLFVSPERLTSVIGAVNKTGTAENVWNNEILDYIKGGMK